MSTSKRPWREDDIGLGPHDSLVFFSSYRDYDPDEDLSYGDLNPCGRPGLHEDEVRFVLPGYLSGSDYSGGSVEVSNHRLFIEEFGELEGIHNVYGGYGTYAAAVRLDVWRAGADRSVCAWFGAEPETCRCGHPAHVDLCHAPDGCWCDTYADEDSATCDPDSGPCAHQVRAWLDELESYPVYDEDDLCQVEMEAQDEAWESWAESDFAKAIQSQFPDDIDDIDVTDSGRLRAWFEELREKVNVYWENETGNSAHVDIDRIAAQFEEPGEVVEAAEQVEDGAPAHGFKLDLIRRVSYLPYCQTCGLLISDEECKTADEAGEAGRPTHLTHVRIALQRVVYTDPEAQL